MKRVVFRWTETIPILFQWKIWTEACAESQSSKWLSLALLQSIQFYSFQFKLEWRCTLFVTAFLWIIILLKKNQCFRINVKVLYGTNGTFKVRALLQLHFSYSHVFINENKIKYLEQSVMLFLPRKTQVPKWGRVWVKPSLKAEILL